MESYQQQAIKQTLQNWRAEVIARNGFNTSGLDQCAQNSRVIHDVFIDAIAANANNIKCPQDLYNVAYYWQWIDQYGTELYSRLSEYLQTPKRLLDDDAPRSKRICC